MYEQEDKSMNQYLKYNQIANYKERKSISYILMDLKEDEIVRSRGEVANAAVCKTVMHGCKSHRDLEYCFSNDEIRCSYCMQPIASKKSLDPIWFWLSGEAIGSHIKVLNLF